MNIVNMECASEEKLTITNPKEKSIEKLKEGKKEEVKEKVKEGIKEEIKEGIKEEIKNEIEEEEDKTKRNLMFEMKYITISRLYYHISGVIEIILMIIAIIATIGAGCSNAIIAIIIGNSTNDLSIGSYFDMLIGIMSKKEFLYKISQRIFDRMKPDLNEKINTFLIVGAIMFVCNIISIFLWSYTALRQMSWMKKDYFRLILKQEQGWFDENNAYEFATKVQAQLEQIELGIGDRFGQLIMMITEIISGFIVAFISSWKLSLVLLTCFPFIIAGAIIMGFCMKGVIVMSRKTYETAGGIAEELLYNIKTVTSFVNFDFEIKRFGNLIDEVEKYERRKSFISGISIGIMIVGIFVGYTFTLLYARKIIIDNYSSSLSNYIDLGKDGFVLDNSEKEKIINIDFNFNDFDFDDSDIDAFLDFINREINNPEINVGDVQKVLICIVGAIIALGEISPNIQLIREACIASSDYFTLCVRIPNIYISRKNLTPERNSINGRIEFKDIKFIYPTDKNKKLVLNGLNLNIEPGKKIAFVGESGCGKSTTVNLLERLYEPTEGQILLDGIDIKDYNLEYLRTLIGFVQQEPVLFNKSIRENIFFGRYEQIKKELGDPEKLMNDACTDAYIIDFINKFPEKYDYTVGVKGTKLSGGQKQRIAIARAILAQPKILILDEATSALDNQSEKEVQSSLDNISKRNVTTLIIAHRLSTIKNADIIYVFKSGKVEEMGTHEELLAKNGYYAHLVKAELGDDQNNARIQKQISKKRSIISKLSKQYSNIISNIQINEKKESKIEEEKIKINKCEIMNLISDHKLDLILGTLGGFIYGGGTPLAGFLLAKTLNALSPQKDVNKMKSDALEWSLFHLFIAIIGGLSIFLKIWKLEGLGAIITSKIRKKIFHKYLELHIGFYDRDENTPGSLLTKLSIDTSHISPLVLSIFGSVMSAVGGVLIALIIGFYYDWKLGLITSIFIPFLILSNLFKAYFRQNGKEGNKELKVEAGSVLSECVINTKTIFSFNFQENAIKIYENFLEKESSSNIRDSLLAGVLIGLGVFITFACQATVFKHAFIFMKKLELTYQNMNLSMKTLLTVNGITHSLLGIAEYPKAKLAFRSIYKILNEPSKIIALKSQNKINKEDIENISPNDLKGKIEFKNVSFAYPTKPENLILKKISLTIEPGQSAALVGFSGCGKSTIIQLIERYYDVDEGEVLIDDINIKDYDLFELRKKIGLVSQEPILFKRSIYENILYGKLDADKEEVFKAAENAAITKFFKNGEKGEKDEPVSGGEKQRIAIARAFLKDPVILLLDEATSALDKESEIEVQKSINLLQKGRTSIAIAHRLATIVDSNIIFVLESGRVIEKGTHKELLEKKGKYYTLYNN